MYYLISRSVAMELLIKSSMVIYNIFQQFITSAKNRVGGENKIPPYLSHHRTYRSIYGGSLGIMYLSILSRKAL